MTGSIIPGLLHVEPGRRYHKTTTATGGDGTATSSIKEKESKAAAGNMLVTRVARSGLRARMGTMPAVISSDDDDAAKRRVQNLLTSKYCYH